MNSSAERLTLQLIRDAFPWDGSNNDKSQISPVDWPLIAHSAEENALAPLLYASLKKRGRENEPPANVTEDLRTAYLRTNTANWLAFQELGSLLNIFEREQIPVVLLKGCALATTLYPEFDLRPMSDIDLLIPHSTLDHVQALLIQQGYTPPLELGSGYGQRFSSYQAFHRNGNRPAHVEVHWHLFKSPYYCDRIPINWFWNRTSEIDMGGTRARAFTPEAQLLHLSAHYALHHRAERLIWSYDLALLLARYRVQMNWEEIIEAVRRFGLIQPFQMALSRVRETWGVSMPDKFSSRLDTIKPSLEQRIAFAMMTARWGQVRVILDGLSMPGVRKKLGVWLHHIFPSIKFMRERYRIRDSRWVPLFYLWRICDGLFRFARSAISTVTQQ